MNNQEKPITPAYLEGVELARRVQAQPEKERLTSPEGFLEYIQWAEPELEKEQNEERRAYLRYQIEKARGYLSCWD